MGVTLEQTLTLAIFDGFWEGDPNGGETWDRTPEYKRAVFRTCARRAIEAAKAFKEAQALSEEARIEAIKRDQERAG